MKPNLTKDQRKRLFLLARLLDRVPKRRFKMNHWIQEKGVSTNCGIEDAKALRRGECGYAGCAMGWGMTSPTVRGTCRSATMLFAEFGFYFSDKTGPGERIFGTHREVSPRTVASDIRRYLKDGTLPTQ